MSLVLYEGSALIENDFEQSLEKDND